MVLDLGASQFVAGCNAFGAGLGKHHVERVVILVKIRPIAGCRRLSGTATAWTIVTSGLTPRSDGTCSNASGRRARATLLVGDPCAPFPLFSNSNLHRLSALPCNDHVDSANLRSLKAAHLSANFHPADLPRLRQHSVEGRASVGGGERANLGGCITAAGTVVLHDHLDPVARCLVRRRDHCVDLSLHVVRDSRRRGAVIELSLAD